MDGGTTESSRGGKGPIEGLGSLEGWWNTSGIALWSFVLFGAFLLNITLLLAFLKRPGLRTISNRFVMNLTVSNLLTCAILNPLLMMDGPSSSGSPSCSIAESATAFVTSSSVLSVLLIAIDQYLAVVDPLRYRTRIDKLKCGILVISIWLVSAIFSILAGLNPSPRSVWLVCGPTSNEEASIVPSRDENYQKNETSMNFTIIVNTSQNYGIEGEFTFTEIDENVRLYNDNTTEIMQETFLEKFQTSRQNFTSAGLGDDSSEISYGLVYSLAYALFAYLVPFIGVCWIYVNIYSAAHKNSERTRRTGSRPILSSGSFSDEYYPVRQDVSTEDFRRIPKISSLSSIDESMETLPSQMMPRRSSEFGIDSQNIRETEASRPIDSTAGNAIRDAQTGVDEEETSGGAVIFTVGSSKVDVSPQQQRPTALSNVNDHPNPTNITKDNLNHDNKVPTAVLKAQFLGNTEAIRSSDEYVRSKFRDEPEQKRKSSHDLMYEEMLRSDLEKLRLRQSSCNEIDRNSSEDLSNFPTNDNNPNDSNDTVNDSGIDEEKISERIPFDSIIISVEDDPEDPNPRPEATSSLPPGILIINEDEDDNEEEHDLVGSIGSMRKNSLDYSSNNHHHSNGSSILKNQHCSFFNGKIHSSRASHHHHHHHLNHNHCYQKTDFVVQSMNYEEHIYGKNASLGHLESHGFGINANTPIVTITPPNKTSLQRVSSTRSTSSYINSLKHRISNGSLFKYREETRAARISALVIVMGLICWTPYVVVIILKNLTSLTGKRVSHESDIAAISFIILATYVSPLLFGYRSRRVKRELRKFFCFRRELSYKNNRSLMAKKVLKRRHSGNMSQLEMDARYNIFNCVYGRTKWPKDKVHFVQVPETALVVETCRSSFSSGASTQISSTSTEDC